MAKAVKNTLSARGALSPSKARTPRAKAMSVAIGISPPGRTLRPGVDGDVDQRGQHRSAQGRGHGQRRAPHGGELAHEDLALYLEADDQEEHRHQPVVDPVGEVLGEREVAHPHAQLRVPQRGVALGPGGVCPHEGDNRCGDQEDATGRLLVGEVLERANDLHHRPPFHYAHVAHSTLRSVKVRPRLFTRLRGRGVL